MDCPIGRSLAVHWRLYYILNPDKFRELQPNWRDTIPSGFSLNRVESESIFEKAQKVPVFTELDSWESFDTFQKYGFGYYLEEKSTQKIASGCLTRVVAVKSHRCEIALGTDIHYQRRGFATLVASAAVDEALKRGLDVIWECNYGNTASINTNQEIGFEYICDENFHFSHLYESLEMCLYYGYCHLDELNDPEKAVEWFQKGIAKSEEEHQPISAAGNLHAARAFAVTGDYDAAIQRLYEAVDRVQNPENFLNRLRSEKYFDNLHNLEDFKKIQHILEKKVKKGG